MSFVKPRRMRRMTRIGVQALLAVSAAAANACSSSAPPHPAAVRAASTPMHTEAEIRDLDISFYAARAKHDTTGAADLAHLASLYLQRSRETGDPRDAERAEHAARRSLRNRSARNDQAAQVLASSLLAQHRFAEALVVARAVRDRNPEAAQLRAMVGEIEMELGQYDSARVSFASVRGDWKDLSIAPRLARWAEIEGRVEESRWLLRTSLAAAAREPSMPREQMAWFWLRAGDLELRSGKPARADSAYHAGLAVHPGDYRLLAALARSASTQEHWQQAIAYGEEAVATNLDPATLGLLSDAYAAMGDTAHRDEYARVLDVAVSKQPGAYHRAWSLFLLDHDRHLALVSRKIREELRTRRDVYGYDLLAWSLYKQGRIAQASDAMTHALGEHTRDAQLFYHAGVIARAAGDSVRAAEFLTRAGTINPYLTRAFGQ
jgi:tetratricopeptide (TPR) repeat protein